ncbi:MAG TPA: ABC transporter permease [Jatrophihabitans sp.]|jgi:lipooligosaccharide transport system permease protein
MSLAGVIRQADYYAVGVRQTWKGAIFSSVLQPVGYLAAMGVGLGTYIDNGGHRAALGGLTYLQFLAPALVAVAATQFAVMECTFPVMGRLVWNKVFHSMVHTPLTAREVVLGQLSYVAVRTAVSCAVFLAVIACFGAIASPWAALIVPGAVLLSLAFSAPLLCYTAWLRTDSGLSVLFRFGFVPAMLFSGSFFPITSLPAGIRWLAYVVPLWHGVDLSRSFASGHVHWLAVLGHVAYLLAWLFVGFWFAARVFTKRLSA